MSRARLIIAVLAVVALLAGGVLAFTLTRSEDVQGSPGAAAGAFLSAWEEERWNELGRYVFEPPPRLPERHQGLLEDLHVASLELDAGAAQEDGDRGLVPFEATVEVSGLGEFSYRGRVETVRENGRWWVEWSPRVVHPHLDDGDRLRRMRTWPERAPIEGHDGVELMAPREAVIVGITPQRIQDRPSLLAALEEHLGVDSEEVAADLDAPGVQPDWFIPVKQLRPADYEAVRPAIYDLPGTVFDRTLERLAPSDGFAAHVLGRTGEVTAERLDELGAPYVQGDVTGLSGLERLFERRLAGRPSGAVQIVDADHRLVATLHEFEGAAPKPVRTTLDERVQQAAEDALAGVDQPAAVVAVDAATGDIRAVVARPLDEFNRALTGRYPPGSTFKIVTAAAALADEIEPDAPVDCPGETTVDGRRFRNAGDAQYGRIPFSEAFARSCNTVFAPMAAGMSRDRFERTARDFGFGRDYELALGVFGGRFPVPSDDAEAAAAGIGQGRVEASPLHMATVAAAVGDGMWRAPRLLTSDEPGRTRALDALVVRELRRMMRLVVTEGTGTAASVPGRTIRGKTGTAEFGDEDPPQSHAWFVGYEGDLAVAVLVEAGGGGGEVAAPIAARFFQSL